MPKFSRRSSNDTENCFSLVPPPDVLFFPLAEDATSLCNGGAHAPTENYTIQDENACSVSELNSAHGVILPLCGKTTVEYGNGKNTLRLEADKNAPTPLIDHNVHNIAELESDDIVRICRLGGVYDGSEPLGAKISSCFGAKRLLIDCSCFEREKSASCKLCEIATDDLVGGAKILCRALSIPLAELIVDDDNSRLANKIEKSARGSELIKTITIVNKYRTDNEKILVYSLNGREIARDCSAAAAGYAVFGAEAAVALYRAVAYREIKAQKYFSLEYNGAVRFLRAYIGTPISSVLKFCGINEHPIKIVNGNALTGVTCGTDFVINASVSRITVLGKREATKRSAQRCIRCGRCVNACPIRLLPHVLYRFSEKENLKKAEKYGLHDCINCACCDEVCPAALPISSTARKLAEKATAACPDTAPLSIADDTAKK